MNVGADVSAVIVNYRSAQLTVDCVANLRAEGIDEVVVVDSASGDGIAGRLDDSVVFVPLDVNPGYGGAVNAGVAKTSRPFVVISNPDLTVEPGTVAALATALAADPSLGMVGPRIDRPDGTRYPSARTFPSLADAAGHGFVGLFSTANPWSQRYLRADAEHAGPVDWVSGAFSAVRKEAFDAVDGFDETFFMFLEDVDLCRRLHRAGWGVAYEPAGRVVHLEGQSRKTVPYRMILAHHRSLLRYGWRTGGPGQRALTPVIAAGLAVRATFLCARTAVQARRHPAGSAGGRQLPL